MDQGNVYESYTRTGKITYTGGHFSDELTGVEIEIKGVPVRVDIEKDGHVSMIDTFNQPGQFKLSIRFEYESDAMTALDAIISAAVEAKRAIENRHYAQSSNLNSWAEEVKSMRKKCLVCRSTDNLEAHHLESKHYSPSLMYSLGNGITLCRQCHDEFHAYCGGKKASRHLFYKWMQSKGKFIKSTIPKSNTKAVNSDKDSIVEIAMEFYKQNGILPSKRKLAEIAQCTEYKAWVTLNELKEQIGQSEKGGFVGEVSEDIDENNYELYNGYAD